MQGVYKIVNKVNGKYYVGSSRVIEERWNTHRRGLEGGSHTCYFQNAWNKYGKNNFIFELAEKIEDEEDLIPREQEYLDEGFELGVLYNISQVAGGGAVRGSGWHHTEATKAKMSKALTGRKASEETKAKIGRATSNPSKETRAKLRKAQLGKEVSAETRAKISKAIGGPYPAFYNSRTKMSIPAGENLTKLCRGRNLNYAAMWNLKQGNHQQSKDGWRLE